MNILLTLVTLGFYYPWAKVRTKKYFYGNTLLDNEAFEYLADPKVILRGYLIGVGFLLAFSALQFYAMEYALLLFFVGYLLFPWILVRSFRFNAIMSSWRGIRFNFQGKTLTAWKELLIAAAVYIFSFGLAFPYIVYRWNKFIIDNHQYGISNFKHNNEPVEYFKNIYLFAICFGFIFVVLMTILVLVGSGVLNTMSAHGAGDSNPIGMGLLMLLPMYLVMLVLYLIAGAVYQGLMIKMFYDNNSLANNYISNELDFKKWVMVAITNVFLLIITLGFYFPWAVVRVHRLIAESTSIEANNLDGFIAHQQKNDSALGLELGEAMDFDLGL